MVYLRGGVMILSSFSSSPSSPSIIHFQKNGDSTQVGKSYKWAYQILLFLGFLVIGCSKSVFLAQKVELAIFFVFLAAPAGGFFSGRSLVELR